MVLGITTRHDIMILGNCPGIILKICRKRSAAFIALQIERCYIEQCNNATAKVTRITTHWPLDHMLVNRCEWPVISLLRTGVISISY